MNKENHIYFFQITSLSSILSGMIGKLVCHPIDTIKSRLQIQTDKISTLKGHFVKEFQRSVKTGGIKSIIIIWNNKKVCIQDYQFHYMV